MSGLFLSWVEDLLASLLGPRVCEREDTSIDAHFFACAEMERVSLVARFRTLKPETFSDEKLTEVSRDCRLLFIGLWCFVDDMGRKAYEPKRIQLEIFPADHDLTPKQVDKWARELARVELIRFYKSGHAEYLWIPHFLRHQRIDRPSHSIIPPHPADPEPDCCCANCRLAAGDSSLIRHDNELYEPHNYSRKQKPNSRNVPDFTRRALGESSTTRGGLGEPSGRSGMELNQNQDQHQNQNQPQEQNQTQPIDHLAPFSSQENRRTPKIVLDEIAMRMLQLLELKPNSLMLQTLTKSITLKARSKGCSYEASAQQIAARAAFVAAENPPDNWVQWFEDVGYEYVPQGDDRLRDRHIEARPICGGSRCSEGWEIVKVNNVPILRRCPDCAQLWQDSGV